MRVLPVSALIVIAASACLVLTACGFQPLYSGPGAQSLGNVTVSVTGDERLAYLTETALMERVGVSDGRTGSLTVTLRTAQQPLGVSTDGQASRVALNIRASYQLDDGRGARVRNRVTERVVFETPREPYALISARANAERRAADAIAEAVIRDALLGLRQHEQGRQRPDVRPLEADDSIRDD